MSQIRPALLILLLSATPAAAQVITPAAKPLGPQGRADSVIASGKPGAKPEANRGADFLTQASLSSGSAAPEMALQAIDLYFSRQFRFYLRTTLPVTKDSGESDDAELSRDEQIAKDVSGALLDEYGGLLYMTGGVFRRLGKGPEEAHGLFLDARAGVKVVDISEAALDTSEDSFSAKVTPFYTGMAGIRFSAPLYSDPEAETTHLAGGFVFGVSAVVNGAADPNSTNLFDNSEDGTRKALPRWSANLNVSVAVSLPGIAYISLTGTPWSSDTRMGKRFIVAFNLVRPQ